MDSRNRKIIVLAIVLLIAGAMVASFGRSLFALNTPEGRTCRLWDQPPSAHTCTWTEDEPPAQKVSTVSSR